ncbi:MULTISPECIES: triose-phosphate isomerase family protein [Mesobacillus]|uniref:Triosephosphate isomerase n=2 Tax=Mesobacillus TaxID=2675231 RepID=A0A0D6ZC34_9BACI|nr:MULTISPECIES: triose-phosphate isomerase family protein [Mesobacillus]KIY23107.1 triosephosphate isomerase [Mesobacillus subterraneus]MDQ0415305.1 triosephosphate isomerase [Mesobacillus stamsii]
MKRIYANLKRFDIPAEYGGINRFTRAPEWGNFIVRSTMGGLKQYANDEVEFVFFLPETHLINALNSVNGETNIAIGCQSVFREDTAKGGNFGAFTSNRTANSMKAIGCLDTIIGHSEERNDKEDLIREASGTSLDVINRLLNKEIKAAIAAGMSVLYCIGEKEGEQERWQEILREQLKIGLEGVETSSVTIAYEPIWAIGPKKTPPGKDYIQEVARFVKQETNGLPVIYGGGLKAENAGMLASIPEIDGGLVALTRFEGEIGFYPEEYLDIVQTFLGKNHSRESRCI